MVHYKLIYFDVKSRAEVSRLLFFLGGQEFEDIRIMPDTKAEYKPKAPFGQFPLLEIDDVMFCQNHAINRYLAEQFGYAGKTPLEKFRADMIVDCSEDLRAALMKCVLGEDGFDYREDKVKAFEKEKFPELLDKVEAILIQNNGGDRFFVGDDITWADMTIWHVIEFIEGWGAKANFENTPKLKEFLNRMHNYPKIVEWQNETKISQHPFHYVVGLMQENK